MTLPLTHWTNPRATIASVFADNDIEYATHGALEALKLLRLTDLSIKDMAKMTILDYGCGTGRMSRVYTGLFKHVYAYDPVIECIAEAKRECAGIKFNNLTLTNDLKEIPKVDFAVSLNVIEHLTDIDANIMITNLKKLVKGDTAILFSLSKNTRVMTPYLTDSQLEEQAIFQKCNPSSKIYSALVDFKTPKR
ncbi:SAM-dependent methyltransferase [Xanthomonas phage Xoo-sp13]|nr:SAM-dependent methyltransferase [Xanthomonas phage Xoo-sp13]